MKTKEELNALKKEVETVNEKLAELTDEELAQVSGGLVPIPYWMGIITSLTGGSYPKEQLPDEFKGNHDNGSGGGVYNEGNF